MKNYNENEMNFFIVHRLLGKEVVISRTNKATRYYQGVLLSLCDGFALIDTNPSGDRFLINLTNMDIKEYIILFQLCQLLFYLF